ncbi:Ig-like domain-containing protein, partial [Winogradskyella sp. A3E31]|uniref:Ig-like domain-containing protein n=1 Tax=Winogradskyella sp. A3E31 TaxID=3349637 RepID=UPI00398B220B
PNDPCDPMQAVGYTGYDSTNTIWQTADCDGDGVSNGDEFTNGTDPYSNPGDTDGDGIDDDNETNDGTDLNDPCDPFGALTTDSDGDGLTDCEEITGMDDSSTPLDPGGTTSDPNDACSPVPTASCQPVANDDTASTDPGMAVIIDITSNDTDPDGTIDDSTIDLDPSTPGQQSTITIPGEGVYTDNGDGTITFSPDPGFTNDTSTIMYTVNDNDGNTSTVGTISITVPACPNSVDSDGDGLTDCEESTGVDDPSTAVVPSGITDLNDPCDPMQPAGYTGYDSTNAIWQAADCDGDGV